MPMKKSRQYHQKKQVARSQKKSEKRRSQRKQATAGRREVPRSQRERAPLLTLASARKPTAGAGGVPFGAKVFQSHLAHSFKLWVLEGALGQQEAA